MPYDKDGKYYRKAVVPKKKGSKVIKYCVISSSTAIILIFISLIPISKKAFYWNQCFKKTSQWIDKYEMKLKNWDKESKESIAVAVCNGAVYETKPKKN